MPETCIEFISEGSWYIVKRRGDFIGNLTNKGKWLFVPTPFNFYGSTASEMQEIANKLNELNIEAKN